MEKLIKKIQEQLDNNWPVEADDIQALISELNIYSLRYVYWKERCRSAERYIEESPCDPDIKESQFKAYKEWIELVRNPYGIYDYKKNRPDDIQTLIDYIEKLKH